MVVQKPTGIVTHKENYIVMDFDGDGIWGIKIPDYSRFSIPSWMKKKM
jgi:hypothetical protein